MVAKILIIHSSFRAGNLEKASIPRWLTEARIHQLTIQGRAAMHLVHSMMTMNTKKEEVSANETHFLIYNIHLHLPFLIDTHNNIMKILLLLYSQYIMGIFHKNHQFHQLPIWSHSLQRWTAWPRKVYGPFTSKALSFPEHKSGLPYDPG